MLMKVMLRRSLLARTKVVWLLRERTRMGLLTSLRETWLVRMLCTLEEQTCATMLCLTRLISLERVLVSEEEVRARPWKLSWVSLWMIVSSIPLFLWKRRRKSTALLLARLDCSTVLLSDLYSPLVCADRTAGIP